MINKTIAEMHNMLINKEITPSELVKQAIDRLKKTKHLNSVITDTFEQALILAKKLDKMEFSKDDFLFGIPYSTKDNFCTLNVKTTAGSKSLDNFVPKYNSKVVEILNENNAISIAKTNLDELGMGGHGLYSYKGNVLNPWDNKRISGGSSSGSTVSVAVGAVAFSLGTDTGDSIRKPAAYNGIVGFKPSYGLISRNGVIPYAPSLDTVGFLTRNVEDNAILLSHLAKHDPRDMTSKKQNLNKINIKLKKIQNKKIAFFQNVYDVLAEPIKKNYDELFNKLKANDIKIEFINFDQELLESLEIVYTVISYAEAASTSSAIDGINFGFRVEGDNYSEIMHRTRTQGFGKVVKRRFVIGSYCLSDDNQELLFNSAKKIRRLICNALKVVFQKYDGLILPPANDYAPLIKDVEKDQENPYKRGSFVDNILLIANLYGNPSITIPCGFWDDLPIGININTDIYHEQDCLDLAFTIEQFTNLKNLVYEGK
ncbi:amidase family protein [Spiroplasma endosymbiont of Amphibalanus improvisus]|uniref:amidase family protein n=1 Tax=Spiroplasma endosymbiont of Amphibalanus improvisus TaxID=3066327 RepID=UPI00313D6564